MFGKKSAKTSEKTGIDITRTLTVNMIDNSTAWHSIKVREEDAAPGSIALIDDFGNSQIKENETTDSVLDAAMKAYLKQVNTEGYLYGTRFYPSHRIDYVDFKDNIERS